MPIDLCILYHFFFRIIVFAPILLGIALKSAILAAYHFFTVDCVVYGV